jgi:hypothetical protein
LVVGQEFMRSYSSDQWRMFCLRAKYHSNIEFAPERMVRLCFTPTHSLTPSPPPFIAPDRESGVMCCVLFWWQLDASKALRSFDEFFSVVKVQMMCCDVM